ncbi:MAG: ssDNA-binding domain-containing protein [Acholeplasmatales bacterium]|jgi:antirestriction protein ArdC|nr:ssDNA-binding domain-containing protein [Acholeplasmatales bacterium]
MSWENKATNEFIEDFIKNLEKNGADWKKEWLSKTLPINGFTRRPYRGMNALNLFLSPYVDPRWFTYLQVQKYKSKEHKYVYVRKGESPSKMVEYFSQYDKKTRMPFDTKTIENLSDLEKKKYIEDNVKPRISFHLVYNAEQIEGIEQYIPNVVAADTTSNIIKTLTNKPFVSKIIHNGTQAFYSPEKDTIVLPKYEYFKSEEGYNATFLHELSHSTGHQDRLNRSLINTFGTDEYAKEELVAEISSMLCEIELGLKIKEEHIENHGAYVKSWLEGLNSDKKYMVEVISDAKKASKYISDYYKQQLELENVVKSETTNEEEEPIEEEIVVRTNITDTNSNKYNDYSSETFRKPSKNEGQSR